ncbi:MAG: hypothetical protein AYK18_09820 [Theionarchaea archaeon DG-70]|nr:MAG: hypothetical protein AYK18_09820 [Theionarchaea archaeon DG-70]
MITQEKRRGHCGHAESDKERITPSFENFPKTTKDPREVRREVKIFQAHFVETSKPRIRRDRRGGLEKLKRMIFFLREAGYSEGQLIPYDDVEYAIIMVSQGLDPRTIRKYLQQLERFHYLEPKGPLLEKISRVTVRTYSRVDSSLRLNPKSYHSKKGYSDYVFGMMAPKLYHETSLEMNSDLSPTHECSSVESSSERVVELLEKAGVTSELCVCDSRGEPTEKREAREIGYRDRKERKNTVTHTYRLSESIPGLHKKQPELSAEDLRILKAAKGEGPG